MHEGHGSFELFKDIHTLKNYLSLCLQGCQEVYDLRLQHSAFSLDADRHDTLDAKKHDDHKEGQM